MAAPTLSPRCEAQVAVICRPPHSAVICPRSAVPGSRWCAEHENHDDPVVRAARPIRLV